MMMVPNGRIVLLWILFLLTPMVGCGDHSESQAPKKPPGLRKKIAVSSNPVAKGHTRKSGRAVPSSRARDHMAQGTKTAGGLAVEPSAPDKRDLVQPKKSDFLALAEGMAKRPEYYYDPRGKHDPFESLFDTETEHVGIAPTKKRVQKKRMPLTPLQRISLGQLKLVAIVQSPNGNKALVEEPSGKGYVISKGTYIGENYQRVKKILKDRIIVEGQVEDFITGSPKVQTTELKLQKKVGDV